MSGAERWKQITGVCWQWWKLQSLVDAIALTELLYDRLQVHAVRQVCAAWPVKQMAELVEAGVRNTHVAPLLISGNLDDNRTVVASCCGKDKSAQNHQKAIRRSMVDLQGCGC